MGFQRLRFLIFLVLLLGACRPKPSATIVPDAALMPLIPADTTILSGVRMAELKKTPVYQRLLAEQKLPQLDEFAQETGIDPRKDIWDIILASNGKTTIALIRGQFTEGGIAGSGMEPKLEKKGVRRFPYKGYTLSGDERVAVTFLNSSVAVAGPTDAVRGVIDARDGSKGGPPKELIDRLRQVSSANQIWMISNAGLAGTMPGSVGGVLLKSVPIDLRSMMATLNLSNGVKLEADFTSGDARSAQKMNDAIRGLIGVQRLTTREDDRDMIQFYDAIQVTKSEANVKVAADVPLQLFERLLETFKNRRLG